MDESVAKLIIFTSKKMKEYSQAGYFRLDGDSAWHSFNPK